MRDIADVVGAATEADHARTELFAGDRLTESISRRSAASIARATASWTEIKNPASGAVSQKSS